MTPGYLWRRLNERQREELLAWRKARGYPWHSPPHRPNFGHLRFLISGATLNYIHHNPVRHGYAARWADWPWSSASGAVHQNILHKPE